MHSDQPRHKRLNEAIICYGANMTISCFTYNGEMKILQLHLGILAPYVDRFIVIEANKTFSGNAKPLYFFRDQQYLKEYWNKIDFYPVDQWDDIELWQQALASPNTQGAQHWKREFYIKESIHKALIQYHVQPDDTLFIGDVDEIIDPTTHYESTTPVKAKLDVYTYWLNNKSDEQFWGTLICQYKDIQHRCLNHLRSDKKLYTKGKSLGWHFTNMGGLDEVRRKLDDSYTAESYNTPQVQELLRSRLKEGKDYLGRDFTFTLDESRWPAYLKKNRDKFKSLCK